MLASQQVVQQIPTSYYHQYYVIDSLAAHHLYNSLTRLLPNRIAPNYILHIPRKELSTQELNSCRLTPAYSSAVLAYDMIKIFLIFISTS